MGNEHDNSINQITSILEGMYGEDIFGAYVARIEEKYLIDKQGAEMLACRELLVATLNRLSDMEELPDDILEWEI